MKAESWQKKRNYSKVEKDLALAILEDLKKGLDLSTSQREHPKPDGGGFIPKHALVAVYHEMVNSGQWDEDDALLLKIRMKPTRTLSGVTTVTVLTRFHPCPGKCIFCPQEDQMPKSYLRQEPGAMRGLQNNFDPYAQVKNRIGALTAVGHPTDKIELLILGGSFSAYPRNYQEWFIRRCFEAMNEVNPDDIPEFETLQEAQKQNVNAKHRNVGLVIETRPDLVNRDALRWYRYLGVTKVQLGAQSLDDQILEINKRGHTAQETLEATALLRAGGFKVVLHWMPNLLGATPESDREDFKHLWGDGAYCPDELKIYPCQLLENTELYDIWKIGQYQPYFEETLLDLITDIKTDVPRYCRINRIIRDIPSTYVVEGNKNSSLRQDVQREMSKRGTKCKCIRCREIRKQQVSAEKVELNDLVYKPAHVEEHFLSFDTTDDHLAGFLRLSLPTDTKMSGIGELEDSAIIREVHVYGQSLEVGEDRSGMAQHSGLGTRLLVEAESIAKDAGYRKLAVIAAVGTRGYYADRGYKLGDYYMIKDLD
ncbi:MAG: tRNA uridine(34) 5-carboxymethylaminomethyl modification radical SAM/GNAT enzyme Elp3 [Brevefilum sp.]|nr:tRNA uridine(34) 5-carboxymethylaminomethyl modification radical SAM/GNAT enzyme Elp3 [Brevefilum sp.]MDT8380686.1 tRNA uridine(34) 5-carboxymethylaminomethyl modification radical SAM/GNAT enzyme Elp3 [Brevefilum sp.]